MIGAECLYKYSGMKFIQLSGSLPLVFSQDSHTKYTSASHFTDKIGRARLSRQRFRRSPSNVSPIWVTGVNAVLN